MIDASLVVGARTRAEVAISRSAFAARFAEQVGEPVMRYVTRWRMHLALSHLRQTDVGIGELASGLGYQSEAEAAFSRVQADPGLAARRGPA